MGKEGVAAVDRALSILDAFTERDHSLTLTEISRRTGFYKSTALRLTESLAKFGYLWRLDDGSFRIGPKPLQLGALYQRQFRTVDVVPRALRRIVDALSESASFYIRDRDRRICLHRIDSPRAIQDSVREGDTLPVGIGASGHVLQAFNREPGALNDEIREQFFSASAGERDPETAAVACPVFGPGQKLAGAIGVSGPKYRLQELPPEKVLPVLLQEARELTRLFGGDSGAFPADLGKKGLAHARLWPAPRAASAVGKRQAR